MGLLDADAEELKKNAAKSSSEGTGSGRRVNQSGLGAFKGLSKYANLTAKYRTEKLAPETPLPTAPQVKPAASSPVTSSITPDSTADVPAENLTVEQQSGTNPTSPLTSSAPANEVSAKPVQSQGEVGAVTSSTPSTPEIPKKKVRAKSVLSRFEVSAKSVQSQCKVSATQSSRSVLIQAPSAVSGSPSDAQEFTREVLELLEVSKSSRSTLATEAHHLKDLPEDSLTDSLNNLPNNPSDDLFLIAPKSGRSQGEVGAEVSAYSVQSPSELSAKNEILNSSRLSSQCEVRSQVRAPVGAKLVRSQCKLEPLESVTALAGAQRIVIEFLFERCLWNNSMITPPITKQQLREGTQLLEDTALSAVKRLRKKAIIDRYAYKDGQAGWTQYLLADESYRELLHLHQFSAKSVQSQSKVSSQVSSEVSARASSSSSSFIKEELLKTNTENSAPTSNELPREWESVDCSALHEIKIFLGKTHIRQIYSRKWCGSAQDLQESIDHFAFFMANVKPDKAPKEPIAHFMAIMRDGHYYGRPEGYLSAEERSQQSKLEAEEKKAQQLRSLQQLRFDALFEQWFSSLRGKDIQALTSEVQGYDEKKKFLKFHFLENYWLDIKDNPSVDVTTLQPVVPTLSSEAEFQAALSELDERLHEVSN